MEIIIQGRFVTANAGKFADLMKKFLDESKSEFHGNMRYIDIEYFDNYEEVSEEENELKIETNEVEKDRNTDI